jgi:hypothetical protein
MDELNWNVDDDLDQDLMDLIDPEEPYAIEELHLAGRILWNHVARNNYVMAEADYERALVRSVELAHGEWSIA